MKNEQKLASLLGLAQKAGKLSSGDFAVDRAIKSGKAKIILVAADASEGTKKSYKDMAKFYNVSYYETLSKIRLGEAIGKPLRAAAVITDEGFTRSLLKLLASQEKLDAYGRENMGVD